MLERPAAREKNKMISECSDHPIVIKIDALLHFSKD